MNSILRSIPALRWLVAGFLGIFFLSGCDLFDQLRADKIAMATLLKTPDIENPANGETIDGATTFTLFFGQIDPQGIASGSTDSFSGLKDAEVTLEFKDPESGDTVSLNVADQGGGSYTLESLTAEKLVYHSDTEYTVVIKHEGSTYKLAAEAPKAQRIALFEGSTPPVLEGHPAGQDLEVARLVEGSNSENPIGFVSLSPLDGDSSSSTYTNLPSTAVDFLKLALDPEPWKQDSFTIEGKNFAKDASYMLTLSTVENGKQAKDDDTSAVFASSFFLVGNADGGVVLTGETPEGENDGENDED